MQKKLLTAKQVSEILGIDIQRVWDLRRRNLLPCVRLGERQFRFCPQAIEHFIENGGNSNQSKGANKNDA